MTQVPPDAPAGPGAPPPPDFFRSLFGAFKPPEWMVDETQNRLVLFLNHVLQQEPVACERLRRQAGKALRVQWGDFHLTLAPTRAGLLERADPAAPAELTLTLTETSPIAIAQRLLTGDRPAVDIQGDVQLAADAAWLVDNVRWDVEEDLSRFVGDAPAHALAGMARRGAQALKAFVDRLPRRSAP